jgi:hypothetical protein
MLNRSQIRVNLATVVMMMPPQKYGKKSQAGLKTAWMVLRRDRF